MFERSAAYVAELWAEERWRIEEQFLAREAAAQQQLTDLPRNVDGLDGADVYLLILESYGRALFDSEQSTEAFGEWSTRLTRQVDDAGFAIVSRFMAPSIRGGQSSLAHAELLTGIKVENRRIFDRLLISDLVPLPRIFANSGYHTVNAQPAMDAVWPASRQFFGFTEDRFNDSLPYDGPWFPWGYMPDQYALQLLLETEVRVAEEPLFLQYVGVTSHAPYTRTPRYYPVWADTQGPDAYDNTDAAVFDIDWLNFRGHPDVGTAYLSTLGYSLQTAIGFLGELERPSLVIVIGDHQPPSAGGLMRDTPTMDVLCHVMSNAPMLMQPFRSRGFVDGFRPPDDAGSVSFSRFLSWFLVHFGRQ